uniref:DUF4179 domain-containing protein n=1 Tax=Faecalicatena contorta TaxID=39482 RepID=UPI00359C5466
MNRQDHDIELKEALQNDIKIPEIVDSRMEEMYDKIRSGEVRMKQLKGSSQKKRLYRGLGIAAAAACMVIVLSGVFYVNPALAKDIPLLGDVFGRLQKMREDNPYPEKDKTAYSNIEKHSKPVVTEPEEEITNVAEDQGITISVTDAYCDGLDLYFTLSMRTEDPELNTADRLDLLTYKEGDPVSFWAWLTVDGKEAYTTEILSGKKSEDGVYVSLMRIPLSYVENGEFTENTAVEIHADAIGAHRFGEEEDTTSENYGKVDFSRLGFKSIKGSWTLKFKPTMDTTHNKEAEPNAENNGFIVQKVTQTPSNMHIELFMPEEYIERNPAVILTDTNGNRVYEEFGSNTADTENGGQIQGMVFDHSDATQFILQVIDKNGDMNVLAEIPFGME